MITTSERTVVLALILTIFMGHNFAVNVKWGSNFGSVESSNVRLDCESKGKKVCCGTAETISQAAKHKLAEKHLTTLAKNGKRVKRHCTISRKYFQSPFETAQFKMASAIEKLPSQLERNIALIDFVTSQEQVDHSVNWLKRVVARMGKDFNASVEATENDSIYLSRYEVTKICNHSHTTAWNEWIEPLTVQARHPFSNLHRCCTNRSHGEIIQTRKNFPGFVGLMNVDYVLTQSAVVEFNTTESMGRVQLGQRTGSPVKQFLFDAGSSTYPSSSSWFTCAYSQAQMYMDSIFNWEVTLLEPNNYWKDVPSELIHLYHFYNIPIQSNVSDKSNPLTMIKALANLDDFVAFKLDVDTPAVEIPIALQILSDPEASSLIDEFFFELHFQSVLLEECWLEIPDYQSGLRLDLVTALDTFLKFRTLGIRAHFWP